jgi:hypothetical protein
MSKSYRKPYSSPTGNLSAKKDKQIANRAVRRKIKNYIKMNWEEENFLLPNKYECSNNEVYGWSRDGKQRYQQLNRSWNRYCLIMQGCWIGYDDQIWPPIWYHLLVRK